MASRTVKFAAIQMEASPASTESRLERADALSAQAVETGAQVIALPEVFNTGYAYTNENYLRAEALDGSTVTWMKAVAAQYNVYLVGTLFLLDVEDVYNAMLLVSPEGQVWRYDKIYPWAWERAYFRDGERITIAETPLGTFGMLICWDMAHPDLWARYAGKIDMMLVCSCPPSVHDLTLVFPDGKRLPAENIGLLHRQMKRTGAETFGAFLRRQSATLGVPMINTSGTGLFSTTMPLPKVSLLSYTMGHRDVWSYLSQADVVRIEAGYFNETYIADAGGRVLAQVPAGAEHFAMAEVALLAERPQPTGPQPRFGVSPFAYVLDEFANVMLRPVYRRAVRRIYGKQMTPVTPQTRRWVVAVALVSVLAWLFGGRRRSKRCH